MRFYRYDRRCFSFSFVVWMKLLGCKKKKKVWSGRSECVSAWPNTPHKEQVTVTSSTLSVISFYLLNPGNVSCNIYKPNLNNRKTVWNVNKKQNGKICKSHKPTFFVLWKSIENISNVKLRNVSFKEERKGQFEFDDINTFQTNLVHGHVHV